jgi:hypothetical protein
MSSRIRNAASWLILGLAAGCGPRSEELPPARDVVASVAVRLGRTIPPEKLTEIAARGDRVLEQLTRQERWALGRSSTRFRVDRRVVVTVAAHARSIPFWLADQGFRRLEATIRNEDGEFRLFEKTFEPGVVGLGLSALDHRSQAHYAIFVRAERGRELRIEPVDSVEIPQRPAIEGESPYVDASKPFGPLPESLLGSTLLLTSNALKDDGALAPPGRVWKTRQPSSARPDQVVVSFGGDPARELSFTWRTSPDVRRSVVQWIPWNQPDFQSASTIAGDSHPVTSDGLLNDPVILRHRVRVTGLEPDTVYAYRVGDGSETGWSERSTIRTAPDRPRDFQFLYLGDAQNGLEQWGELLRSAVKRNPNAGFLLIAGDLVDRGNERSNWDHFFLRAAGTFDNIPLMPCVGNHEYLDKGPVTYRNTFDLPANGPAGLDPNLAYAFEYADAFVAVLDSTQALYDRTAARNQAAWLDEALEKTRKTWKFVVFHHPVYASHLSRENPAIGEAWVPVFDKHHVDLVLQGHDHAYLRTYPMRAGKPVASTDQGTVYVVSVSGEKHYEQNPRDYTARGLVNVSTYQTIDVRVRERILTYRSFDREGREVDALEIHKPPARDHMARRASAP